MPGTGKTVLANQLRAAIGHDSVLVCAPTGKAASLHAGGMTIQSASQLGREVKQLKKLSATDARLAQHDLHLRCTTLFIDEYGMCPAAVFALVFDRYKDLFGSYQGRHVVLFGDPFQLPPVGKSIFDVACDESLVGLSLFGKARDLIQSFRQHVLYEVLRVRDPFGFGCCDDCNPGDFRNAIAGCSALHLHALTGPMANAWPTQMTMSPPNLDARQSVLITLPTFQSAECG
jgi:hypothetical protein